MTVTAIPVILSWWLHCKFLTSLLLPYYEFHGLIYLCLWWRCIVIGRILTTLVLKRLTPQIIVLKAFPVDIYLSKVYNRNTRMRRKICSKLTIKTSKSCLYCYIWWYFIPCPAGFICNYFANFYLIVHTALFFDNNMSFRNNQIESS